MPDPSGPWGETHSEPARPRKPRRLGLYIPWAVAVIAVVGWSLGWLWMEHETEQRLDASLASLKAAGWQASWASREVSGYPFRLDVDVTNLVLAEPGGWGLAAPLIKSEAYVFAPDKWLIAVPNGLTFTRPDGAGAVVVGAHRLRASISAWDATPPKLAVEGDDVTFAAAPGARPFSLASAKSLQFDTQAAGQRSGVVYLEVQGGTATNGAWLAALSQGAPVSAKVEASLVLPAAFKGADWRTSVVNWIHGGGVFDVVDASLSAGGAGIESRAGGITVADDGRLVGVLQADLTQPARVIAAFSGTKPPAALTAGAGPTQSVRLTFRDDEVWVGPFKLAPSPRVFDAPAEAGVRSGGAP